MCIDLKSFYASVECAERGLDPFTTNLVVADPDREKGTICLAITPAMKALGVKNRCRVYEIPTHIDYITAPPRMQLYIEYSAAIYGIYLKYISKNDIHVYSIDESFLDVTSYMDYYGMTANEIGKMIMDAIFRETSITATCGIGTNMYLAKIALDIVAKHTPDHIGVLSEDDYCKKLWSHKPLTDFWRVGPGTAKKLAGYGVFTMGELAKMSQYNEDLLYKMFGVDAEILIDHAYGREPTKISDIKKYKPKSSSLSSGQVLLRDYRFDEAKLVTKAEQQAARKRGVEEFARNMASSFEKHDTIIRDLDGNRLIKCKFCGRIDIDDAFADYKFNIGTCKKCSREVKVEIPEQVYIRQRVASLLCPECGAPMRERKGQYGNFMGCSNYPICRGTRYISK